MSEETRDPTDAELALASCVLWYADQASQNDTWWANDPDLQLARDILGVPASGRVTHQHLWARDDVLKVATAAHLDGRTRYIISANGIIAERYLAVMDSGSLSVEDKRGPVTEPGAVARVRAAIERYEGD